MEYAPYRCACAGGITCAACLTWNTQHHIHMPHQRKAGGRRTGKQACVRHERHNRRCPDCLDRTRAREGRGPHVD